MYAAGDKDILLPAQKMRYGRHEAQRNHHNRNQADGFERHHVLPFEPFDPTATYLRARIAWAYAAFSVLVNVCGGLACSWTGLRTIQKARSDLRAQGALLPG